MMIMIDDDNDDNYFLPQQKRLQRQAPNKCRKNVCVNT